MMEYKFRGKRKDGEWVHGSLITNVFFKSDTKEAIPYILDAAKADYDSWEDLDEGNGLYEVDPETVGQYTGLHDKDGREICDGDILRFPRWTFNQYIVYFVEWKNGVFRLIATESATAKIGFSESVNKGEIIGNIHETERGEE